MIRISLRIRFQVITAGRTGLLMRNWTSARVFWPDEEQVMPQMFLSTSRCNSNRERIRSFGGRHSSERAQRILWGPQALGAVFVAMQCNRSTSKSRSPKCVRDDSAGSSSAGLRNLSRHQSRSKDGYHSSGDAHGAHLRLAAPKIKSVGILDRLQCRSDRRNVSALASEGGLLAPADEGGQLRWLKWLRGPCIGYPHARKPDRPFDPTPSAVKLVLLNSPNQHALWATAEQCVRLLVSAEVRDAGH